jgi:hypothetical protein
MLITDSAQTVFDQRMVSRLKITERDRLQVGEAVANINPQSFSVKQDQQRDVTVECLHAPCNEVNFVSEFMKERG